MSAPDRGTLDARIQRVRDADILEEAQSFGARLKGGIEALLERYPSAFVDAESGS